MKNLAIVDTLHGANCDCLECIKTNTFTGHFAKHLYMYPDHAESYPGEYLDGELVALVPVNVYSRPDGSLLRTVKKGGTVGKILSYVVKDGVVWWQLYGPDGKGAEFVKHGTGVFDKDILMKSLAAEKAKEEEIVKKAAEKRMAENTNPLYRAGKDLESIIPDFGAIKWVLYGIAAVIALLLILRIAGK